MMINYNIKHHELTNGNDILPSLSAFIWCLNKTSFITRTSHIYHTELQTYVLQQFIAITRYEHDGERVLKILINLCPIHFKGLHNVHRTYNVHVKTSMYKLEDVVCIHVCTFFFLDFLCVFWNSSSNVCLNIGETFEPNINPDKHFSVSYLIYNIFSKLRPIIASFNGVTSFCFQSIWRENDSLSNLANCDYWEET